MTDPVRPDRALATAKVIEAVDVPDHRANYRNWFRGAAEHRAPDLMQLYDEMAVDKHILRGWLPAGPAISPDTKVTAFGSCFAKHVSNWLSTRQFNILTQDENSNAYVVSCAEGMVNSFVIRQQFDWAFENKVFEAPLWHGYKAEEFGYDEDIRQETLRLFSQTDVFILTFGLSEVWYDEPTGGVFWRTLPRGKYDPERHRFRVSTVAENAENIRAIYDLIRKHRPDAKIIITLSPIPLMTTFREVSTISANSVSKATLRIAIDEVMRDVGDEGYLHYWPSYEIVMDLFQSPFKHDGRHVRMDVLDYIMMTFERHWCEIEFDPREYLKKFLCAKSAAGHLIENVGIAVKRGNKARLEGILTRGRISPMVQTDDAAKALIARYVEMI